MQKTTYAKQIKFHNDFIIIDALDLGENKARMRVMGAMHASAAMYAAT